MMKTRKKNYTPLFFLMIIFVLPVMMGWFLYYERARFQFNTINHGILVNPPLNVESLYSPLQNGSEKKWRMIYVNDGTCNQPCKTMLYDLHQIQKALGKDSERVLVLSVNGKDIKKLESNRVYLVDPLGNLFMYYPNTTDPMNILKDMKHVLGVSQIG